MCVPQWVWWRWRVCMKNTRRRNEGRRALRKGNQTHGTKPPPLAMLARHVYEGRSHAFSVACVCVVKAALVGYAEQGKKEGINRRREPSQERRSEGTQGKQCNCQIRCVLSLSFFYFSYKFIGHKDRTRPLVLAFLPSSFIIIPCGEANLLPPNSTQSYGTTPSSLLCHKYKSFLSINQITFSTSVPLFPALAGFL